MKNCYQKNHDVRYLGTDEKGIDGLRFYTCKPSWIKKLLATISIFGVLCFFAVQPFTAHAATSYLFACSDWVLSSPVCTDNSNPSSSDLGPFTGNGTSERIHVGSKWFPNGTTVYVSATISTGLGTVRFTDNGVNNVFWNTSQVDTTYTAHTSGTPDWYDNSSFTGHVKDICFSDTANTCAGLLSPPAKTPFFFHFLRFF